MIEGPLHASSSCAGGRSAHHSLVHIFLVSNQVFLLWSRVDGNEKSFEWVVRTENGARQGKGGKDELLEGHCECNGSAEKLHASVSKNLRSWKRKWKRVV